MYLKYVLNCHIHEQVVHLSTNAFTYYDRKDRVLIGLQRHLAGTTANRISMFLIKVGRAEYQVLCYSHSKSPHDWTTHLFSNHNGGKHHMYTCETFALQIGTIGAMKYWGCEYGVDAIC